MRNVPRICALLLLVLSAQTVSATAVTYHVILTGPGESPPNASPGTGIGLIIIDTTADTLSFFISFSGLLGPGTASHIHCCTALPGVGNIGVVTTFTGFPFGATSGAYAGSFDMTLASTWSSGFITASGGTAADAESALAAGAAAGEAYLNIHSTVFPGGEIRGFLVPVPVATPEPSTLLLLGTGLLGLVRATRRKWLG